jgi:hypothetical protein
VVDQGLQPDPELPKGTYLLERLPLAGGQLLLLLAGPELGGCLLLDGC